jgi:hypothetical protein
MNQICDGEIGTSLAWNRFDSLSRPRRQALSGGRAAIRRRRSVTFIPRSHHGPRASGEVMDREWENGRARLHESPNGPEHAAVDRSVSQPVTGTSTSRARVGTPLCSAEQRVCQTLVTQSRGFSLRHLPAPDDVGPESKHLGFASSCTWALFARRLCPLLAFSAPRAVALLCIGAASYTQ